jgi:predicted nucleic acid-binding protein
MPATFVDTSALYALLDRDDDEHERAATAFAGLREHELLTHNYVVVEAVALAQARLGMAPARELLDGLLAVIAVQWVTAELHATATAALLASGSRRVSLVDRVSFAFMRDRAIHRAFAFDRHFRREGFALVP